MFWLETCWV